MTGKVIGFVLLAIGASSFAFAGNGGFGVPEIDPGSAVSVVAMLSGGLLMVRGRRKK
jgi:hypothetical protein